MLAERESIRKGETGIIYKARPGRLEINMLSVPVEGEGFKKSR